ncbi:MAG: helix-turn-helix transcriptional regulator [Bacteroidota bacterium]
METVGQIIRIKRESQGLLLRQVAAHLDIDQAILSKIERNERKPTKENIIKISEILNLDKDELLVQFMSDKIAYEIADEDCANRVLKVAEKKVKYLKAHSVKN